MAKDYSVVPADAPGLLKNIRPLDGVCARPPTGTAQHGRQRHYPRCAVADFAATVDSSTADEVARRGLLEAPPAAGTANVMRCGRKYKYHTINERHPLDGNTTAIG